MMKHTLRHIDCLLTAIAWIFLCLFFLTVSPIFLFLCVIGMLALNIRRRWLGPEEDDEIAQRMVDEQW